MNWTARFIDGSVVRKSGVILKAIEGRTGLVDLELDYKDKLFGVNFDSGTVRALGEKVGSLLPDEVVGFQVIAKSNWKSSLGIGAGTTSEKKLVAIKIGLRAAYRNGSVGEATIDVFEDATHQVNPVTYVNPS